MAQIRRALLEDLPDRKTLLEDCKSCDKFGNDLDTVDHIAVEIVDDYMRYLHTKPTWRGGIYTADAVRMTARRKTVPLSVQCQTDGVQQIRFWQTALEQYREMTERDQQHF